MVEDDCVNSKIPLHNVTSNILSKVIEYCKKHIGFTLKDNIKNKAIAKDLKSWDTYFYQG
ncbi:putative SKP1/BTB/POZ domain superfamily, SKP1 component, POZ domain-containing protein [Dioscorea sansibarensis]